MSAAIALRMEKSLSVFIPDSSAVLDHGKPVRGTWIDGSLSSNDPVARDISLRIRHRTSWHNLVLFQHRASHRWIQIRQQLGKVGWELAVVSLLKLTNRVSDKTSELHLRL